MILVGVRRLMGENQCGIKVGFERFEVVLDLGTLEREVPVAEANYFNPLIYNILEERSRAAFGFGPAGFRRAEDHPSHRQVGNFRDKAQHGSTATDFNVI